MKIKQIVQSFLSIFIIIAILTTFCYCTEKNKIFYMLDNKGAILTKKPLIIYADINGDSKEEKIILQNIETKFTKKNSEKITIYLKSIQVFKDNKLIFNYKDDNSLTASSILYITIIRFPDESSTHYRDLLFMVCGEGQLNLNILYWESNFNESGEETGKSKVRYLKTNVEVSTPYGFFEKMNNNFFISKNNIF